MFKKIISILSNMETIHLTLLPLGIGLVPLVIFFMLPAKYFGKPIEEFLLLLTFFIWGLTGLPMIVRKEAPWLITIRGWLAVVEGVVIILVFWTLVIIWMVVMIRGK